MSILIGDSNLFTGGTGPMFFRGFDFLQSFPAFLREKVFLIDQLNPVLPGKRFRALAIHHYVSGFVHHQPGQAYRIFDMFQRSDCAGIERVAIHNRRIHLVGSSARKD